MATPALALGAAPAFAGLLGRALRGSRGVTNAGLLAQLQRHIDSYVPTRNLFELDELAEAVQALAPACAVVARNAAEAYIEIQLDSLVANLRDRCPEDSGDARRSIVWANNLTGQEYPVNLVIEAAIFEQPGYSVWMAVEYAEYISHTWWPPMTDGWMRYAIPGAVAAYVQAVRLCAGLV